MAKQSKSEALTLLTMEDKISGKMLLNLKSPAFDSETRKRIVTLTGQIQTALTSFMKSTLQVGQYLSEARLILQGRGERVFVAFLNSIPGLTQPTAYRYINTYETAKEVYPENILNAVLASGLPLIGRASESAAEDNRFGKYTEVIRKRNLLPPSNATPSQAREWIEEVQREFSASKGTKGKKKGAKVPDLSVLQEEAFRAVVRRWDKVPKDKRNVAWLKHLFSYVLGYIGVEAKFQIESKQPPSTWTEGTEKSKEKEKENDKLQKETDKASD